MDHPEYYASNLQSAGSSLGKSDSYTAEVGKDRFDHCRAKNLIYQSNDARPTTPQKSGKKGAPGGLSSHHAPYATLEELSAPASPGTKAAMAGSFSSGGGLSNTKAPADALTDEHLTEASGFDPAVYAANRAANQKIKEESARRNFRGNGAILSHPVADTTFAKP